MKFEKVLGIEELKTKKGTFFKLYVGELVDNCEGYKVKDYFVGSVHPDCKVGDDVTVLFGSGYDSKAFYKGVIVHNK